MASPSASGSPIVAMTPQKRKASSALTKQVTPPKRTASAKQPTSSFKSAAPSEGRLEALKSPQEGLQHCIDSYFSVTKPSTSKDASITFTANQESAASASFGRREIQPTTEGKTSGPSMHRELTGDGPPAKRRRHNQGRGTSVTSELWESFVSRYRPSLCEAEFRDLCIWLALLQDKGYSAPVPAYDRFIQDFTTYQEQYEKDTSKLPGFHTEPDFTFIPSYYTWFKEQWKATRPISLEPLVLGTPQLTRIVQENPMTYLLMDLAMNAFDPDPCSTTAKAA